MALALAQYEDIFQLVSGYLYGARGAPTGMISACQVGALVSHYLEESLCLLMGKPNGPNLLDEPLKGFIVNPADLPWKWVKRLATLGERVNHDSQ